MEIKKLYGLHMKNQNSGLDIDNPHISLGWSRLGDLTNVKSKEELDELHKKGWPDRSKNSRSADIGQIELFLFETKVGDHIIYRKDNKIHIGEVVSDYYYDNAISNQDPDYCNNKRVTWLVHYPSNVLSDSASHSLGSAKSYFNMDKHISEISKLVDGTYLDKLAGYKHLKEAEEIDSNSYDGSFELIKAVVKAYNGLDINTLNYLDLEVFYYSIIGTWKSSFDNKRKRIDNSNLPDDRKQELIEVVNRIEDNTVNGEYSFSELKNKRSMGLFGTGFGSFKKVKQEDCQVLLDLFINVNNYSDEDECLAFAEERLNRKIRGVKTGVVSPILFSLNPTLFPIINGNQGAGILFYEKLGIIITSPTELDTYVQNTRNIREFRNKHFTIKHYRLLDDESNIFRTSLTNATIIRAEFNKDGIFTCESPLSSDDWVKLLENKKIFSDDLLEYIKAWYTKDNHEASCTEIVNSYYNDTELTFQALNLKMIGLCKTICSDRRIKIEDANGASYFPIMFFGRNSSYMSSQVFNWILRPEVVEGLEQSGLVEAVDDDIDDELEDYTKDDFLSDVFMDEKELDEIIHTMTRKKNIILQGSPGVGKTYMARRLAYLMMGKVKDENISLVQFHQSYSYEDFIMGYKPNDDGSFSIQSGIFIDFVSKAIKKPDEDFFFIIDEINRGNLSKIFGELLMLIENDKRGQMITLAHSNKAGFVIPENLYIIGTMNTADRSLAIVDYALRRRFSSIEINPAFDNPSFKAFLLANNCSDELANDIVNKFIELNNNIANDPALGNGFRIGHSYFCSTDEVLDERAYKEIIKYDIAPILREYWYDDLDKANRMIEDLLR